MAFVRICAHFLAHDAGLEDGQLPPDAHRLAGIPAVLIRGRLDRQPAPDQGLAGRGTAGRRLRLIRCGAAPPRNERGPAEAGPRV
jgi:hypothetical protein